MIMNETLMLLFAGFSILIAWFVSDLVIDNFKKWFKIG